MKAKQQSKALEGIKKEQLKRHNFTLEFKAEAVRYKTAENLTWADPLSQAMICKMRIAAIFINNLQSLNISDI